MKILAETHCHTIASTHAYSTISENIAYAKQLGFECLAITDHTPGLVDSPHIWHFRNMRNIPRVIDSVILLRGAEANIMNDDGEIDLDEHTLNYMDITIASFHSPCYEPKDVESHTKALLNLCENKYIDVIGHPENEAYRFDYDTVIKKLTEKDIAVEFNNHSFAARKGAEKNYRELAQICKKYKTKIVVSSDAHICYDIGHYEHIFKILEECDFPEEQIMNTSSKKLINWLQQRHSKKIL